MVELKSQIEAYKSEMERVGEQMAAVEAEHENLVQQYTLLNQENQELHASLERAQFLAENSHLDGSNGHDYVEDTKKTVQSKMAPRMFCDICDEFDLHETEDCPQQMMQAEADDVSLHSKHEAKAKISIRAYCDLCETFGHEEENCPTHKDKAPSDEEF